MDRITEFIDLLRDFNRLTPQDQAAALAYLREATAREGMSQTPSEPLETHPPADERSLQRQE